MAEFKTKTIEYENILKTDFIPDFADKVNVNDNILRDNLLDLYNSLHITLSGDSGNLGTDDFPITQTASAIKIVANDGNPTTNGSDGIVWYAKDEPNNPIGSVTVSEKGTIATFTKLNVSDINVSDGDLNFGTETEPCAVEVNGSLTVNGSVTYSIDKVTSNSKDKPFIVTDRIDYINLVDYATEDEVFYVSIESQEKENASDVRPGTAFRFVFNEVEGETGVSIKSVSFGDNVNIVGSTSSIVDVPSTKTIEVIVLGVPSTKDDKYLILVK